jgi:hypothetical protein
MGHPPKGWDPNSVREWPSALSAAPATTISTFSPVVVIIGGWSFMTGAQNPRPCRVEG